MRFTLIMLIIALFLINKALAQTPDDIPAETIEIISEETASETEDETDYTELTEALNEYLLFPLNLNTADEQELSRFIFLSSLQITSLIEYRSKNGQFFSIYELALIKGFDLETIKKLSPFIQVHPPAERILPSLHDVIRYSRNEIFLRAQWTDQQEKGYQRDTNSLLPIPDYPGSGVKYFLRYAGNYQNRILWGITAENDAQEDFFTGSNPQGFDFYSAHLYMRNIGKIKQLALGDFQAQFGQGLILWSGMNLSKTPDAALGGKFPSGILKYSSSDENRFMRGAALCYETGKIRWTGLVSRKRIDANLNSDSASNNETVASLPLSGFHATASEIENENALTETLIGGDISLKTNSLHAGITASHYQLSAPLEADENLPYKRFAPTGNSIQNLSAHYNWLINKMLLFGEYALSSNGGRAVISGATLHPIADVGLSIIFRDYTPDYFAPYSNAFAENTDNQNERGLYTGISFDLPAHLTVRAYADLYSFPWLKYGVDAPSSGIDRLVEIRFAPSHGFSSYLRLKSEKKWIDSNAPTGLSQRVTQTVSRLRIHAEYPVSATLSLRSRIEFAFADAPRQKGLMAFQDIRWQTEKKHLSVWLRYAIFDTDSYLTRIYAYENDVLYAFSIPAYQGKGVKAYANMRWTINRHLSVWLRYGFSRYFDSETISSGLNEINGPRKTEWKVQLRYKF